MHSLTYNWFSACYRLQNIFDLFSTKKQVLLRNVKRSLGKKFFTVSFGSFHVDKLKDMQMVFHPQYTV